MTKARQTAFTLVEVVLALGIVSFSLVAIIGLLAVAFDGMKEAREQSAAAFLVKQIGSDIRGATKNGSGSYVALGICNGITWTPAASSASANYQYVTSLGGVPTTKAFDQRLVAHILLTPPSASSPVGKAEVSVAWPAQSVWNSSTSNWDKSKGSLFVHLSFIPQS